MSTQVNRYRGRLLAGFAGTALAASFAQSASAAVMTSYSFEGQPTGTTTGTTLAPLAANVGTGSFTGVHASASTAYSFPSGNGTANSSSSNTWATGDYYQFTSPGTAGLQIEFDQTSSSTGPGTFQVQYSADGVRSSSRRAIHTRSTRRFRSPPPRPRRRPRPASCSTSRALPTSRRRRQ